MSDSAERIDKLTLGNQDRLRVIRYADNDVQLYRPAKRLATDETVIVFSWNQINAFTDIVEEAALEKDVHPVESVESGTEESLGDDQMNTTAVFKRDSDAWHFFELDGEGSCQLNQSEIQGFYEYVVEAGYSDLWGIDNW